MNDLSIFVIGCIVSLVVVGAVGLLLWGAANEPEEVLASRGSAKRAPSHRPAANTALSTSAERYAG